MQGIDVLFSLAIVVISASIHEASHGFAAYFLGDSTAKDQGRLTVNPLKHLDLFGSIIIPLLLFLGGSPFLFGWAKPVPFNPYNLKNQKWGPAIVGLAGPLSNFFIAGVFGLLFRFASGINLSLVFGSVSRISLFWGFILNIVFVNIVLGTFNLIPIPPLDGSRVLGAFLPYHWKASPLWTGLEQWGIMVVFLLMIFFPGFLNIIISSIFNLFVG